MNHERSGEYFAQAQRVLVGGVNSPNRDYAAVGGLPVYVVSGVGPNLVDVDGNNLLDYMCGNGSQIVGHAHPEIVSTLKLAATRGLGLGTNSRVEIKLAAKIVELMPALEKVRFVNSGSEATMSAIRLARAATGRPAIIRFIGSDHGHSDMLLSTADGAGVTAGAADDTLTAQYNDLDGAAQHFADQSGRIAAVIVEPVTGGMGVVPARKEFLLGLRELCSQHGALLIFDEVRSGFRVDRGGAQELFGIKPDLTCLGRIIGGGLPVGAIGGPAHLLDQLAPLGSVCLGESAAGNALVMVAGLATLDLLTDDLYVALEERSADLTVGLRQAAAAKKIPVQINRVGSMLSLFFCDEPINDWNDAQQADTHKYAIFFRAMLEAGIHLPPSPWEPWYVSGAHTSENIERTVGVAEKAFKKTK